MILVTGGAGYIGSHACVELLKNNEEIVVFDNLSNSSRRSLERVQQICGRSLIFVEGEIRNGEAIEQVLCE